MAALRGGIKTVLIPQENKKDLAEIPDNVKKNLEIIALDNVDQVLDKALVEKVSPIEWKPEDDQKQGAVIEGNENPRIIGEMTAH